jgi:hypothetical protein
VAEDNRRTEGTAHLQQGDAYDMGWAYPAPTLGIVDRDMPPKFCVTVLIPSVTSGVHRGCGYFSWRAVALLEKRYLSKSGERSFKPSKWGVERRIYSLPKVLFSRIRL